MELRTYDTGGPSTAPDPSGGWRTAPGGSRTHGVPIPARPETTSGFPAAGSMTSAPPSHGTPPKAPSKRGGWITEQDGPSTSAAKSEPLYTMPMHTSPGGQVPAAAMADRNVMQAMLAGRMMGMNTSSGVQQAQQQQQPTGRQPRASEPVLQANFGQQALSMLGRRAPRQSEPASQPGFGPAGAAVHPSGEQGQSHSGFLHKQRVHPYSGDDRVSLTDKQTKCDAIELNKLQTCKVAKHLCTLICDCDEHACH